MCSASLAVSNGDLLRALNMKDTKSKVMYCAHIRIIILVVDCYTRAQADVRSGTHCWSMTTIHFRLMVRTGEICAKLELPE